MKKKYLTLEQNTCSARVFLNTFGFILESVSDISEFSLLKILNREMEEVGKLRFSDGKVMMNANYKHAKLEAFFDIAELSVFSDLEGSGNGYDAGLFGSWSSNIHFSIQSEDDKKIAGTFLITSSADTFFGVSCRCHPLVSLESSEIGKVTLQMLRGNSMLFLENVSSSYREMVDICPTDWLNGFLKHTIYKGEYHEETYRYDYEKYAGIFKGAEVGENVDKLHVFLSEVEGEKELSHSSEFVLKMGKEDSTENLQQKGNLMKKLDPDMFLKIEEFRKLLIVDDISLLDNFVSVCFDDYMDAEIEALLGIRRRPMIYQDGSTKLVDSYFGLGKNNYFLPLEAEKKLVIK